MDKFCIVVSLPALSHRPVSEGQRERDYGSCCHVLFSGRELFFRIPSCFLSALSW